MTLSGVVAVRYANRQNTLERVREGNATQSSRPQHVSQRPTQTSVCTHPQPTTHQ